MVEKELQIKNKTGLHARPASQFVKQASKFQSKIMVRMEETEVNAKSMVGVLSLGAGEGSSITLSADGTDEADAVDTLEKLLGSFTE